MHGNYSRARNQWRTHHLHQVVHTKYATYVVCHSAHPNAFIGCKQVVPENWSFGISVKGLIGRGVAVVEDGIP